MAAPTPLRDALQAIGRAVAGDLLRRLDATGRTPLRPNSALKRALLAPDAVRVVAGPGGNLGLQLFAPDYLPSVDAGRRPFARKVPLAAILRFIQDRNLRYRAPTTGRFARARVRLRAVNRSPIGEGTPAQSVNKLAFLIQNAIYRRGIRARPVLLPAFALGQDLLDRYLDEQLLAVLAAELDARLPLLTP
ncbi:hypothetical protein [Hymenobacter sp.]|uniref:hypothetical protein n=1 Tax=Hymenobacter sp. TaxID=1898978 RepID=UPI00286B6EBA|nr:hypothetical protein [Hymenobacter sp.]